MSKRLDIFLHLGAIKVGWAGDKTYHMRTLPPATKDLASGIVEILQPASHRRGVEINIDSDCIVIDLYVVIEYGTPIATVARNIQSVVKYTVERALSVPVNAVNVHVQDLRVGAD